MIKLKEPAEDKTKSEPDEKTKHKCDKCGYVYDPAVGHKKKGIEPGISFSDFPDDWACPQCGAPKAYFGPLR